MRYATRPITEDGYGEPWYDELAADQAGPPANDWYRGPRYIVIRVAHSYPHQVPDGLDGQWFDVARFLTGTPARDGGATAYETGRFEQNEDGDVAQVWEIR